MKIQQQGARYLVVDDAGTPVTGEKFRSQAKALAYIDANQQDGIPEENTGETMQKAAGSDRTTIFIPLAKIDQAKHQVWGYGAVEEGDVSDEIMDYQTSKPHFTKWSSDASVRSGGKSLGNLRSMHQSVAAGRLIEFKPDDKRKGFWIGAEVVDPAEWAKVEKGVYTGFSIGGDYAARWYDPAVMKTRYTAKPIEISLVDAPCIPSATFQVVKADQSVELRKFAPTNGLNILKAEMPSAPKAAGTQDLGPVRWSEITVDRMPDPDLMMQVSPGDPPDGASLAARHRGVAELSAQMTELMSASGSPALAKAAGEVLELLKAEWDESKHKRGKGGQFAAGPGGEGGTHQSEPGYEQVDQGDEHPGGYSAHRKTNGLKESVVHHNPDGKGGYAVYTQTGYDPKTGKAPKGAKPPEYKNFATRQEAYAHAEAHLGGESAANAPKPGDMKAGAQTNPDRSAFGGKAPLKTMQDYEGLAHGGINESQMQLLHEYAATHHMPADKADHEAYYKENLDESGGAAHEKFLAGQAPKQAGSDANADVAKKPKFYGDPKKDPKHAYVTSVDDPGSPYHGQHLVLTGTRNPDGTPGEMTAKFHPTREAAERHAQMHVGEQDPDKKLQDAAAAGFAAARNQPADAKPSKAVDDFYARANAERDARQAKAPAGKPALKPISAEQRAQNEQDGVSFSTAGKPKGEHPGKALAEKWKNEPDAAEITPDEHAKMADYYRQAADAGGDDAGENASHAWTHAIAGAGKSYGHQQLPDVLMTASHEHYQKTGMPLPERDENDLHVIQSSRIRGTGGTVAYHPKSGRWGATYQTNDPITGKKRYTVETGTALKNNSGELTSEVSHYDGPMTAKQKMLDVVNPHVEGGVKKSITVSIRRPLPALAKRGAMPLEKAKRLVKVTTQTNPRQPTSGEPRKIRVKETRQ